MRKTGGKGAWFRRLKSGDKPSHAAAPAREAAPFVQEPLVAATTKADTPAGEHAQKVAVEPTPAIVALAPEPEEASKPVAGGQKPSVAEAPVFEPAALTASLRDGAAYVHVFDETSAAFAVGAGLSHSLISDADGARLRLADGDPKAAFPSSGMISGAYSVRLPDEVEKAASGRKITVRLLGRSPESAEAEMACAYSTNEVGNSGWRSLTFGREWAERSFTFDVKPMVKGRGDFVGLRPAALGEPAVEIAGFAIDILSEA